MAVASLNVNFYLPNSHTNLGQKKASNYDTRNWKPSINYFVIT